MLEVVLGSLLVGNLGIQTLLLSGWVRWRQVVIGQQNKEEEEEEILTSFESPEEIAEKEQPPENGSAIQVSRDPRLVGWEFKIVRAKGELFRDPDIFKQLCEEEELAGWILLEKLDDQRVRFKRPIALRDIINQEILSFDPYRCFYGPSWTARNWVSAIAAVLTLTIPGYLGYSFVSNLLAHTQVRSPAPPTQPLAPFREPPPTP